MGLLRLSLLLLIEFMLELLAAARLQSSRLLRLLRIALNQASQLLLLLLLLEIVFLLCMLLLRGLRHHLLGSGHFSE